jgi:hypothetical protein
MKSNVVLAILILIVSCKKEIVEKPDRLIEKNKMFDIMYAILEGIKYQNITSLADYNVNSSQYIYKNIKLTVCNSYKAMFITPLTIENISFDEIVKQLMIKKQ